MLYSSMYSFLTALLRDELRHYEIKNPRKWVDFMAFFDSHEVQRNLMRQQILFRR